MITQLESLKMRLKFRAARLQVTCLSMSFPILVHWEYVPVLSLSIYNCPLSPAHIPSAFPFSVSTNLSSLFLYLYMPIPIYKHLGFASKVGKLQPPTPSQLHQEMHHNQYTWCDS